MGGSPEFHWNYILIGTIMEAISFKCSKCRRNVICIQQYGMADKVRKMDIYRKLAQNVNVLT